MSTSRAIRLDAGGSAAAAIALHEVIEVVTEGDLEPVPRAPAYCRELLQWRNQWIPVFDLARWRGLQPEQAKPFLVVVGYLADADPVPRHGCVRVPGFPKIVELADEQACGLPGDAEWSSIAHSCFREDGREVPILRLSRVFEPGMAAAAGAAVRG